MKKHDGFSAFRLLRRLPLGILICLGPIHAVTLSIVGGKDATPFERLSEKFAFFLTLRKKLYPH